MTSRRNVVFALLTLAMAGGAYAYWVRGGRTRAVAYAARPLTTAPEKLGDPRSDLTPEQLAAFYAGQKLFTQPLPGLGPLYNAHACIECHFDPTIGGHGDVAHAAHLFPDPETADAQPVRKYALEGWTVPAQPENVSRRVPPSLFGVGLIEQIPDDTIRAACGDGHPDTAKPLGSLPPNQVARFGFKPFVGTIPDMIDAALLGENGVTSPIEGATDDDKVPDPEVDRQFVDSLAAFLRGLPPPGRTGNDEEGEAAFHALGCATCHVPDMPPAMGVYSNFCLYGMGDALADGVRDKEAQGDEFRTAPLWGLRLRKAYMHDGRVETLEDAIKAHAGDAADAASAYQSAPSDQRAALLRFLATL